jgi:hypothetical protein
MAQGDYDEVVLKAVPIGSTEANKKGGRIKAPLSWYLALSQWEPERPELLIRWRPRAKDVVRVDS